MFLERADDLPLIDVREPRQVAPGVSAGLGRRPARTCWPKACAAIKARSPGAVSAIDTSPRMNAKTTSGAPDMNQLERRVRRYSVPTTGKLQLAICAGRKAVRRCVLPSAVPEPVTFKKTDGLPAPREAPVRRNVGWPGRGPWRRRGRCSSSRRRAETCGLRL
jgi:hypothetical protein